MNIINIEKLDRHKKIVLTGRPENVRKVAKHLKAMLYYVPRDTDYFEDYPDVVNELKECLETLENKRDIAIVTTQSKEFLDCLLESNLDFVLATVRKYDTDDADTYRLRVVTKEYALANRKAFNMEYRR